MKLNRKKAVMENILQISKSRTISTGTQDNVETITDYLHRKMREKGNTHQKNDDDKTHSLYHLIPFSYLQHSSCLKGMGENKTSSATGILQTSGISSVAEQFPGLSSDELLMKMSVSKGIKKTGNKHHMMLSNVVCGDTKGNENVSGSINIGKNNCTNLAPVISNADLKTFTETKMEKSEAVGESVPLSAHITASQFPEKHYVQAVHNHIETYTAEKNTTFQGSADIQENKSDTLIYRFHKWGNDASVSIQPQTGGVVVLQPSDSSVGQRLIENWPEELKRQWYLSSDDRNERKQQHQNSDDDEDS
ncbi:hypothetical protein D1797_15655 [Salmonella enterica subsp. enterica serovar Freetown]|nr:hypothetical protein [Salmonella enterica subsp. enterica serovar Freetown]EBH8792728.1 hypothetical protein [Salmonella enterica subsp. enterica serovar Freetown]EDV9774743.1 hypothetical protein [Salmonella enterica subsp. enterica serovar Poona]